MNKNPLVSISLYYIVKSGAVYRNTISNYEQVIFIVNNNNRHFSRTKKNITFMIKARNSNRHMRVQIVSFFTLIFLRNTEIYI